MVFFNYSTKEITGKIVFYGPGLCGKTTNLQYIYKKLDPSTKGKMLSLATEADRTLFFDFLPVKLGTIRGMKVRFQLYTVPGQVFYNETRKLVLKGVDAIVFVADSQKAMMDANIESYINMEENLRLNGLDPDTIPLIMQYNKRDLPDIATIDELNEELKKREDAPFLESSALKGEGVIETFQTIGKLLMNDIVKKYKTKTISDFEKADKEAAKEKEEAKPAKIKEPVESEEEPEIELDENLETDEHEIELEEEPDTSLKEDESVQEEPALTKKQEQDLEKATATKKTSQIPVKIPSVIDTSAFKRERQEFEKALKGQVDGINDKITSLDNVVNSLKEEIASFKKALGVLNDVQSTQLGLVDMQKKILTKMEKQKKEIIEQIPDVKQSWLAKRIFSQD